MTPSPTHDSEDKLFQHLWDSSFAHGDTRADAEEWYKKTMRLVESHYLKPEEVERAVIEARIDELKKVQVRLMSVGVGENKLSKLNDQRLRELQDK